MVHWWANWTNNRMERSAIGYPSSTVEGRLNDGLISSGMPAGAIVPDVMMPEDVAKVDRAVKMMPEDLSVAVRGFYLEGEDVSRRRVNEALVWLSARLS